MQPLEVQEIAKIVGGTLTGTADVPPVQRVCTDSRSIVPGCLFVPIRGERFDGHDYIDAALEAGAAGCLFSEEIAQTRPGSFYIRVEDTLLALKALAADCRSRFRIPVVQITGSVGKTTTKEMIAAVLGAKLRVLKTEANYNNSIGVPMTLLELTDEHEAAVVETGMNHFGEIRYLGEMVRPDLAVISNIGDAHVEFLGSREGILRAKCEILENLAPDGLVILNGDDALLNTVTAPQRIVRCGRSEHCGVRITDVADHGVDGIDCTVVTERDSYALKIPSPGGHMIYPASMAVAVGEALGLGHGEIVSGIASYAPVGSRMRVLRLSSGRILLDDCYNANPQSVAAALEILAKTACQKKVAVLGDMGELGALTEKAHYNMGVLSAMLGIDLVIAAGDSARLIADGASDNGGLALSFPTAEAALSEIEKQFAPRTAMLVKASHAMHFEKLTEQLQSVYD